jgi:hypothetical protein
MVSDYSTIFMELLWYALHHNAKKMEVKNFMLRLTSIFRVKVRILIPRTLQDAVHSAL